MLSKILSKLHKLLKVQRPNSIVILISVLMGGSWAATLFFFFLQGHIIGKRKLAIALVLAGVFSVILRLILKGFILPRLQRLSYRQCFFIMIFSLMAGFLLIPAIPLDIPPNLLLVPKHNLKIIPTGEKNSQSSGTQVELQGLDTGIIVLSADVLQEEGNWQTTEKGLSSNGEDDGSLIWQGVIIKNSFLYFSSRPDGGIVEVLWDDDRQQIIDLFNPTGNDVIIVHEKFPISPAVYVSTTLLTGFSLSGLIFLVLIGLTAPWRAVTHSVGQRNRKWVLLAVPMAVMWCIYLLVFWPGIMAPDSINQWEQLVTRQFSDLHPLAHTITLWLITRLWISPAAVALTQICALSLVISGGLGMMEEYGLPRQASWAISGLFALSPVMGSMSITLLKDVLFSTAFLALSLLLLKTVLSNYQWLEKGGNWTLLGLAGALTALYRHNGFPVALGALFLLVIVSWRKTRRALFSLLLMLGLWFGVRQVTLLMTDSTSGLVLADTPILHHFGAHVTAGTPLSPEERSYLNAILPLDAPWPYRCFSINSIHNHPDFNVELFRENPQINRRIFLDLLRRAPQVDINHWLCSSRLIWKIRKVDAYMYSDSLVVREGKVQWIEPGPFSPSQASILPGWVSTFTWVVKGSQVNVNVEAIVWRPATYLYILLFCTFVLAIRFRSWIYTLFAIPALLQSSLLFLVNYAQDFRYQFAIYLLGIISLALLFIHPQDQ